MKKSRSAPSSSFAGWIFGLLGLGAISTAYIDPGSGSFLVQVLVASMLGIALLVRAFWGQISALFGRKPNATESSDEPDKDE